MKQDTQINISEETPVYFDEMDSTESESETLRWREDLQAERDARLMLAAEYENYRRRSKIEQAGAFENGKSELLEQLLSLADDFDIALANLEDSSRETFVEGLRLIQNRLDGVLRANNVVPFESKGETFDPKIHEAFAVEPGNEGESGKVHSELRRGYRWNDKLMRPAMVVVTK